MVGDLGMELHPKEIQELKMVGAASLDFFLNNAGILRDALRDVIPRDWDSNQLIIDSRVHHLHPGVFPAIPGAHIDGIEGNSPFLRSTSEHLTLCLGSFAPTGFLNGNFSLPEVNEGKNLWKVWHPTIEQLLDEGRIKIQEAISGKMYHLNTDGFHKATSAKGDSWRYFLRIARGSNRKIENAFRHYVQSYSLLPDKKEELLEGRGKLCKINQLRDFERRRSQDERQMRGVSAEFAFHQGGSATKAFLDGLPGDWRHEKWQIDTIPFALLRGWYPQLDWNNREGDESYFCFWGDPDSFKYTPLIVEDPKNATHYTNNNEKIEIPVEIIPSNTIVKIKGGTLLIAPTRGERWKNLFVTLARTPEKAKDFQEKISSQVRVYLSDLYDIGF